MQLLFVCLALIFHKLMYLFKKLILCTGTNESFQRLQKKKKKRTNLGAYNRESSGMVMIVTYTVLCD